MSCSGSQTVLHVSADSHICNAGELYTISRIELPSSSPLQNQGTVFFAKPTTVRGGAGSSSAGEVQNHGTLHFTAAADLSQSAITNTGTMMLGGGGSAAASSIISTGSVSFAGGAVSLSGATPMAVASGTLDGVGSIVGSLNNQAGAIVHNAADGTLLHISGSFEHGTEGVIYAVIDNLDTPGSGFTQLVISGGASLGGSIIICISDTLANAEGRVDLLTFANVIGNFSRIEFNCTEQHQSAKRFAQPSAGARQRRGLQQVNGCGPHTSFGPANFAVLFGGCNGGSGGGIDSISPSWYIILPVVIGVLVLVLLFWGAYYYWERKERMKQLAKQKRRRRATMMQSASLSNAEQ